MAPDTAFLTPSELHDAVSTNTDSHFKPFRLKLANGATLTGLPHVSSRQTYNANPRPLLIGIHGATCSAYTYDLSPQYTGSTYSHMFGIPIIAFNRPHCLDSSGWLVDRSSQEPNKPAFNDEGGASYFENEGLWMHEYILPALWNEFDESSGCTGIVTTSHFMAVPITIVAAAAYCTQTVRERQYPWNGMILSGFSAQNTVHCGKVSAALQTDPHREPHEMPLGHDYRIHIPPFWPADQADLMLGPQGLGTDPNLRTLFQKSTTPFLTGKVSDLFGWWPQNSAQFKASITLPILYGLGEYDWVWQGTKRNVEAFCAGFVNAERVEGACVEGSPHAIELGACGRGWWIRCCGWALEVTASAAMRAMRDKPAKFEQGERTI